MNPVPRSRLGKLLGILLFAAAGIGFFSANGKLGLVHWDEFLWHPEIARVAEELLSKGSWPALLHPTDWQYPPLFFLAAGAVVRFLGDSFFAMRLLSIVSAGLLAPLAFCIARRSAGWKAGLLAGGWVLAFPLLHRFGYALLVDPFQAFLIAGALALFVRAEDEGRSVLPAAVVAGLAGATKYTSLLVAVVLVGLLLAARVAPAAGRAGATKGGAGEMGRGRVRPWRETALFAAISFAPLLLLRGSDIGLLREMSFWRGVPFDWGDFFRVAPLLLLLLALAAPLSRGGMPRLLRAPYFFLLLWMLFFFWRRQQMNWFLPAVVPAAVLAAHTLSRPVTRPWKVAALAVAVALLGYGGLESYGERERYRETERAFRRADALINRHVPHGGAIVVDGLPFQSAFYGHRRALDVRHVGFRDGHCAVLLPWVFENYLVRGFSGSAWGERHEREIRSSWRLEEEYVVDGEVILQIYTNPKMVQSPRK